MSNRVLITGATGFVGRQVLRHLAMEDILLSVIVREGSQSLLKEHLIVTTVIKTADLFAESEVWWEKALQGIDTVIHLAWFAEPSKYLQSPKNLECLQGTLAMAKGAVKAGGVASATFVKYADLNLETEPDSVTSTHCHTPLIGEPPKL